MLLSPLFMSLILLSFTSSSNVPVEQDVNEERVGVSKRSLSTTGLEQLAELTDIDLFYSDVLAGLLKVRVPGTNGHHNVKMFIINQLKELEWDVQLDQFDAATPFGEKRFANIIATLNPAAKRRLILACHYDSKELVPQNGKLFLASTDSAVPCGMMLEIARTLNPYLKKEQMKQLDTTLQLVFFDGEEAFKEWTPTDSLYGSRHLAYTWSRTLHPEAGTYFDGKSMIESINVMVLLDLLGAKDPTFFDQFPTTSKLFQKLQLIERRLTTLGALGDHKHPYFIGPLPGLGRIEDDHIPFLIRGVPILHVIPYPFPSCWHKMCDDETVLDKRTILNLIKIFRVFVAEYFSLDID